MKLAVPGHCSPPRQKLKWAGLYLQIHCLIVLENWQLKSIVSEIKWHKNCLLSGVLDLQQPFEIPRSFPGVTVKKRLQSRRDCSQEVTVYQSCPGTRHAITTNIYFITTIIIIAFYGNDEEKCFLKLKV